jgi:hypothetical protein
MVGPDRRYVSRYGLKRFFIVAGTTGTLIHPRTLDSTFFCTAQSHCVQGSRVLGFSGSRVLRFSGSRVLRFSGSVLNPSNRTRCARRGKGADAQRERQRGEMMWGWLAQLERATDTETRWRLCVGVALMPRTYWSSAVVFRFGTNPTGMRATSFIDLMSTTDTSLVTGLAT